MSILMPPLAAKRGSLLAAPPGAVLWLPGQDDAYSATIRDRSGKGNNGAITGATWVQNSQGLWALSFGGVADLVTVTDSASLSSSTALTLLIWCKSLALGNWRDLFGKGTTDDNKEYGLAIGLTQLWCAVGASTGPYLLVNHGMTADAWYFIAMTHSRPAGTSTLKGYVNGVDLGGTTGGDTFAPNNLNGLNLLLGKGVNLPSYWNGQLALSRVIPQVWTAAQIQTTFQSERQLFGV